VHELVSLGAAVAIVGRQQAKLDAVAAELAAIYPRSAADV
jgi:short-subunit dehydrogenase